MRRAMFWVCVVALAVTMVASTAAGFWVMTIKNRPSGTVDGPADRAAVLEVARAGIPKIFSYDYQTVERQLATANELMTARYRAEFQKSQPKIIQEARQRQVVVQTNVVGAAIESLDRGSAELLVFMNRTVTDASRTPVYDGSRLHVTMRRADTTWLIDYMTPI